MMWPGAADYLKLLQQRQQAFRDPALQTSTIPPEAFIKARGQPKVWSGAFALVFKLLVRGGKKALRVYKAKPHADVAVHHYRLLSSYLHSAPPLTALVEFEYVPDGIYFNGEPYPILVMDWVEGQRLDDWVGERAARRDGRGDPANGGPLGRIDGRTQTAPDRPRRSPARQHRGRPRAR